MGRAIKDISGKTYKKIKVISFSHSDKINKKLFYLKTKYIKILLAVV